MANGDNLVKINNRTTSEAREISKRGGKKSGEARRKNKSIREALLAVLSGTYEVGDTKLSGYDAIAFKVFGEAMKGNIQAFKEIRDTIGEKPTDKLDIATKDSAMDIKISFVDKTERNTAREVDPKIIGEYTSPQNINDE